MWKSRSDLPIQLSNAFNILLALLVLHFSCFDATELLDRPVESLLMNQADHFRETQEERELLNQVMPLINTGYVRS